MTAQIANTLDEVLQPKGVAVVIEAAHQCMTTRGVHKPGVTMVTSRMLGAFRDDPTSRREVLAMIGTPGGVQLAERLIPAGRRTMTTAAVAILERLVAFDTVSAKSNLALIDWVADYLDGSRHRERADPQSPTAPRPICLRRSARRDAAGSSCRVTPMSCRSKARPGTATRSGSNPPGDQGSASTGAAPPI